MADLSIQSTPAPAVADHTWLAGDSSAFGNAQSGTIQVSSLTSGTHYDATTKVVPAGLAVAKNAGYLLPYDAAATGVADTLVGFVAYPIPLLQDGGALSAVVTTAYLVDAVIIPANLPVAAHRTIDQSTPTSGKFAFVA